MSWEHLELQRDKGVAILTIRREGRRNALHGPLWSALREAAEMLSNDPPRVAILTGAGGHFSSGMDLGLDNPLLQRLAPAIVEKSERMLKELILELKEVPKAIAHIPCPVIAAIEGACAGGGMEIALACDLRVASTEAFFSLPETRVGMVPDVGGTVRSVRLLGRARATELILTGRRVGGEEAKSWGLVTRTCPPGQALQTARALASELMESAPMSTREVLRVLRSAAGLDDRTAFDLETEAGVSALLSAECMEGVAAFVEKRPPSWKV